MYIKFCRTYEIEEPKTKFPDESRGLQELQRRTRLYLGLCVFLSVLSLILLIAVGILGATRLSQTSCHDEKNRLDSGPCTLEKCKQVCPLKAHSALPCKNCDAGWLEFEGTCYYLSHNMHTWGKSREECKKMDGDLAVVDNQRVQEFLVKNGNLAYWIGLIQTKTGEAVWVNGTVGDSYPSQTEGSCGVLIGRDDPNQSYRLSPCAYETAFICQK